MSNSRLQEVQTNSGETAVDNTGKEEKDWVSAAGKSFEVLKALMHKIRDLGGDSSELARVTKEPGLAETLAKIIMGAAEIQDVDPVKVITRTGRSMKVKVAAVQRMANDPVNLLAMLTSYSANGTLPDPVFCAALQLLDKKVLAELYRAELASREFWIEYRSNQWVALLSALDLDTKKEICRGDDIGLDICWVLESLEQEKIGGRWQLVQFCEPDYPSWTRARALQRLIELKHEEKAEFWQARLEAEKDNEQLSVYVRDRMRELARA